MDLVVEEGEHPTSIILIYSCLERLVVLLPLIVLLKRRFHSLRGSTLGVFTIGNVKFPNSFDFFTVIA
jgi:hypothetical protein